MVSLHRIDAHKELVTTQRAIKKIDTENIVIAPNQSVLVLGLGSPFGMDRLGWQVIKALESLNLGEHVSFAILDRPGPRLISYFDQAECVILVDAVVGTGSQGQLCCLGVDEICRMQSHLSSHGFGVAEAVALAQKLGQLPEALFLIGVDIGECTTELERIETEAYATPIVKYLTALLTNS